MKYITAVFGFLLIAGCVHSSTTSAPVNIVGVWKGTFDKVAFGPPQELVFNFLNDGQNVGGFMRNEARQSDWIKLENFKMKGDKIYFTTTTNTPQGKIKHNYNGRLLDSVIKLTTKVEIPGSSGNPLRDQKSSFRYKDISGGSGNTIDQSNPGNIVMPGGGTSKVMTGGGGITFTIRKVQ